MKPGDLVKWIGFPGTSSPRGFLGKGAGIGLVVAVKRIGGLDRYDVLWDDGVKGLRIYPQCLEVLFENG